MFKIEIWEDNPILRKISEEIKEKDLKDVIPLWKKMVKFLKDKDNWWVWLAAPQIWKNIRMVAVWLPKDRDDENYKVIMMINPEILENNWDKDYIDVEWCLSLPKAKRVDIPRYSRIKVSFIDENKKKKTLIITWLAAKVVQHEIDHLDWILFTDYVK